MSLLDTSPGGFVFAANAVLYSVVLAEAWMLTTGSMLAMVGVLVLVVAVAAALCGWMMTLMGPDLRDVPAPPTRAPEPAARPVAAPLPQPAVRRPVGGAVHV